MCHDAVPVSKPLGGLFGCEDLMASVTCCIRALKSTSVMDVPVKTEAWSTLVSLGVLVLSHLFDGLAPTFACGVAVLQNVEIDPVDIPTSELYPL